MLTTSFSPSYERHRAELRDALCAWLLEQSPTSVFDVGAGDGALLRALTERGVQCSGVEASEARVEEARAEGLDVARGVGAKLDRSARSVDWVVIRHVLHHMTAPERAVLEARRVARVGVMLAEPLAWHALPEHRVTARLVDFVRGLERRRGAYHARDLAPGELTSLLPPDWTTEVRVHAPLHRLGPADVSRMIALAAGVHPLGADEQEQADSFVECAELGLLASPGTVMVLARRP